MDDHVNSNKHSRPQLYPAGPNRVSSSPPPPDKALYGVQWLVTPSVFVKNTKTWSMFSAATRHRQLAWRC